MGGSSSATNTTLLARLRLDPLDQGAWAQFVALYGPRIVAWCRNWRLQEADAQDVTQDVLVKLADKMRTFRYDADRSFRGWLKTVTQHALSKFVTRRRKDIGRASASDEMLAEFADSHAA